MKKLLTSILVIALGCASAFTQTDSVFWFATPFVTTSHVATLEADITLTNISKDDANVTVTFPLNIIAAKNVTIAPGTTQNIDLSHAELLQITTNNYNAVENSAIKITSDQLITAYYEVHRTGNNPDIFALKGSNALGQEFWVPFQTRWPNHSQASWNVNPAFSQINIVATKDGTQVTITTPVGKNAVGFTGGVPRTITLNAGETFMVVPALVGGIPAVAAANRLAGTHIVSSDPDKPIAVTIGDDSVQKSGAYDYIGDQIIPLINVKGKPLVGSEYIVMRGEVSTIDATNTEAVFILGTRAGTTARVTRPDASFIDYPLSAGQQQTVYMPTNQNYIRIESNYPVYVLHVSGFGHEIGGALLPKVDGCTGSLSVSFVRSRAQPFYMNLMVKSNAIDSVYMYNGVTTFHIDRNFFVKVPNSEWHILKDTVTVNNFFQNNVITGNVTRVYNTLNVFHLGVINGVTTGGGCRYGYFSDYNELESEVGIGGQGNVFQGCDVDSVRLHSAGGIAYLWSPQEYVDDYTDAEPMSYPPRGLFTFSVKVTRPCFGDTIMYVTTYLPESPTAYYVLDVDRGCSPLRVNLQNGSDQTTYHLLDWDDGSPYYIDPSFDTVSHLYTNNSDTARDYLIRLNVSNIYGCNSVYIDTLTVYPGINADIGLMDAGDFVGCHPLQAEFDNMSGGHTGRWEWSFGDGGNSIDSIPVHIFENFESNDKTYRVKLKAISPYPYNCEAEDSLDIVVHPYIHVNFGADTITRCSPFTINVYNSSTQVDNYFLDFGDGNDTTFNSFNNLKHTYLNLDTVIRIDTLTLIGTNVEGCSDTSSKSITIFPQITSAFSMTDNDVCDSVWINFTDLSYGHDFDYLWEFGDGNSTVVHSPGHLFRNTSEHDTNYIISLRIESPYCSDISYDTIAVHNVVNAGFSYSIEKQCTPMVIKIDPRNTKGDSLYWDFDGDNVTDSIVFNHNVFYKTFENNDPSNDIFYNIRLLASNYGCAETMIRPLIIKPQVVADINSVSAINGCSPIDISFGNLSLGGDLNYTWDFDDGTSSSDSIPLIHTFDNTTLNDKSYKVHLLATHPVTKCASEDSVLLTIYPFVNAGFTMANTEICTPFEVTFTNTSTKVSNESYQWNTGDGFNSTLLEFVHQYQNNTQNTIARYPVSLRAYNSLHPLCESFHNDTVTVYPKVVAAFTPDVIADCNPLFVNFSENSFGFGLEYYWDFNDGTHSSELTPTHTFTNFGVNDRTLNINLQVTDINNCIDDTTIQVTVYPHVNADFSLTYSENCTPFNVNLTNNSTKATGEIYQWDLGDGNNTATTDVLHEYQNNTQNTIQNYPIRLRSYLSAHPLCEAFAYDTLTVYPKVIALFNPDIISGCHPLEVNFTQNSNGFGLDYSWAFDDGSSSSLENPSNIFENYSTTNMIFNVKLDVTDDLGCKDDTIMQVTVNPFVNASFSYTKLGECTPFYIELNAANSKSNRFAWDFDGNGSIEETRNSASVFNRLYNNTLPNSSTTVYPRLITYYDFAPNCTDTISDVLVIPPRVVASFSSDIFEDCQPFTIGLSNGSTGGSLTYNWDFGDSTTSSETDPSHTYYNYSSADIIRPITLRSVASNSCTDDTTINVTVYSFIESDFKIKDAAKCSPFPVILTNDSRGGITQYSWNFGDGGISTQPDPAHTYINTSGAVQEREISLVVNNSHGCSHTFKDKVKVYPQVSPSFDVTIEGCHPLLVQFTNNTQYARDHTWTFGDGSSSLEKDPIHTYNNFDRNIDSVYHVNLTALSSYECVSGKDTLITVHPKPLTIFDVVGKSEACPPFNVSFTNNSVGNQLQHNWNFGDGQSDTETNASHTFYNSDESIAEYNVALISATLHGCTDTMSKLIRVYPEVKANYVSDIKSGCSPLVVSFTNLSENQDYSEWDFDNGLFSSVNNPEHRFVNALNTDRKFAVRLSSRSDYNCFAEVADTITVFPSPSVEFAVEPTHQIYDPYPYPNVELTNWSNHLDTWQFTWNFGDGTNSNANQEIFSKEYNIWGKAENDNEIAITLKAVNKLHPECNAEKVHTIRIIPPIPEITIKGKDPEGCVPFEVDFATTYKYIKGFAWDFDDGGSSNDSVPIHIFEEAGTYNVKLEVVGDGGRNYDYKTVVVHPKPEADFVVEPSIVMIPAMGENAEPIYCYNQSKLDSTYLWEFGDGNTSTAKEPVYKYDTIAANYEKFPVFYDISLKVWSEHGCVDSITKIDAVQVDATGMVKFPNAFTPNLDGPSGGKYTDKLDNTIFHPYNEGVIEYHLEIFTRWGDNIFTSDDVNIGWDGYVEGKLAKQGVYIWKVWVRYANNQERVYYGDITVLYNNDQVIGVD